MDISTYAVNEDNIEEAIGIGIRVFGDEVDRAGITKEFRAAAGLQPEKDSLEQDLRVVDPKYFIFCVDGVPAGFIGHHKVKGHEDDAWVGWGGALPEFRGTGLGRIILKAGIDGAAARPGVKTIRFYTTLEPKHDIAYRMFQRMGFIEEPYRPGAKDAASLVVVFSASASPEYQGDEYLWKNCAYPIDCDKYVIPDMNELYGFNKQGDQGMPPPAGPAPLPS